MEEKGEAFARCCADDALATVCAWRVMPVFDMRYPPPGEDPNYSPLPQELVLRYYSTLFAYLAPPRIAVFDEEAFVSAVGSGEYCLTFDAWLRDEVAAGRVPLLDLES